MVQASVDPPYYWKTAEHRKYSADSGADRLFPWLEEYESFNDTFAGRNKVAFRFAHRDSETWWERLALFAAEPELGARHRDALVHLASACYTRLSGPESLINCLRSREPRVVEGSLILLPLLRPLRMDGRDTAWPQVPPLDPQTLPLHVVQALKNHPEFGALSARALAAYGPSAKGQSQVLIPLLLSENAETAAAANHAIRSIDPSGLAQKFDLQDPVNINAAQVQQIQEFLASSAESVQERSIHPQFSTQYTTLLKLFRERTEHTSLPQQDPAGDARFLENAEPDEWWPVLIAAAQDWEFREFHSSYLVPQIARTLYQKRGAAEVLNQLVLSDDPKVAAGAIQLISSMRQYKDESSHYLNGDLVDPAEMPRRFARALGQHPALCVYVARALRAYGSQAKEQAGEIVPFLLSDASEVVWEIRYALSRIDSDLANELECHLSDEEFQDFVTEFTDPCVLDTRQRIFVERYLETRKPNVPVSQISHDTRVNKPELPDRTRVTMRNRSDLIRPTRPESAPIVRRLPPGQTTQCFVDDPLANDTPMSQQASEPEVPHKLQQRPLPSKSRVRRQPPHPDRPASDPV